jgi:mediator of RNA polymerase II transcription subunit 5
VVAKKIDLKTLLEGVSFFTGRLLNWTLVGVIKALIREAQIPS